MSTVRRLAAAGLAGAASGARSFTGVGALVLATRRDATGMPDRVLARPAARVVAGLLSAGEYVGDKLPAAPSRLEPAGLAGRVGGAAGAGVIVARREPPGDDVERGIDGGIDSAIRDEPDAGTTSACVAVAVAAAVATAWLGVRWRSWAGRRFGTDWVGALAEDSVAVVTAAAAVRLTG